MLAVCQNVILLCCDKKRWVFNLLRVHDRTVKGFRQRTAFCRHACRMESFADQHIFLTLAMKSYVCGLNMYA